MARPTKPVPKRSMLAGSGIWTGANANELDANKSNIKIEYRNMNFFMTSIPPIIHEIIIEDIKTLPLKKICNCVVITQDYYKGTYFFALFSIFYVKQ